MLSNFSQYSPQGLISPQGAGWPQMSPGQFGQPGANSGNAAFGQESGQAGFGPQSPFGFGGQSNAFAQNPLTANPFWQNPSAPNPYLNSPQSQGYVANNPLQGAFGGQSGMHNPQYVIAVLGQLAQQFSVHSATAQQIGIALHQLVQQLLVQSYSGGAGQYSGQGAFAGPPGGPQSGYYGGFNPQSAQAWGANRPQTIQ
jgi:hypothetical protein